MEGCGRFGMGSLCLLLFFLCGPVENMSRNSFVPHSCTQLYSSHSFLSISAQRPCALKYANAGSRMDMYNIYGSV